MLKVGLTGGIASGKSTVSDWLKKNNFPVIDADQAAHDVVRPGEKGLELIAASFGKEILNDDGSLNRRKMADIIFSDEKRRKQLNGLLHPLIYENMDNQLKRHEAADASVVFFDIPLLFENGLEKRVDRTILVSVSEETQLARLMARDRISRSQALNKIRSQLSLAEKQRRATATIDNSGTPQETFDQMRHLLHDWNIYTIV